MLVRKPLLADAPQCLKQNCRIDRQATEGAHLATPSGRILLNSVSTGDMQEMSFSWDHYIWLSLTAVKSLKTDSLGLSNCPLVPAQAGTDAL